MASLLYDDFNRFHNGRMHGAQKVIVFCLLITILPTILIIIPLYLRHFTFADVMYKISDSDVIQIHKGQSSIFCQKHSIKMNTTFNAFQMRGRPELSKKRRHITLRKSMTLPDDTLEYWGFYLFSGATVELKGCSRWEGSKIMVVKGEKIFNTCGILDGSKYRKDLLVIEKNHHVSVTLENPKEKKVRDFTDGLSKDMEYFQASKQKMRFKKKVFQNQSVEKLNTHVKPVQKRDTENTSSKKEVPIHNPNTVLDAGVHHGGNAIIVNTSVNDKSVSSFESNLHECYNDNILLSDSFPYSIKCNQTKYLENTTTLKVLHEVTSDGYYYYIFYSDNDFVRNDLHVIFDIYKPTFQYSNISDSKMCLNKTECEFTVDMFSDELVIVEVPTTDGLQNDDNDTFILESVCHPRNAVYVVFPISVLLMVLIIAFL